MTTTARVSAAQLDALRALGDGQEHEAHRWPTDIENVNTNAVNNLDAKGLARFVGYAPGGGQLFVITDAGRDVLAANDDDS